MWFAVCECVADLCLLGYTSAHLGFECVELHKEREATADGSMVWCLHLVAVAV